MSISVSTASNNIKMSSELSAGLWGLAQGSIPGHDTTTHHQKSCFTVELADAPRSAVHCVELPSTATGCSAACDTGVPTQAAARGPSGPRVDLVPPPYPVGSSSAAVQRHLIYTPQSAGDPFGALTSSFRGGPVTSWTVTLGSRRAARRLLGDGRDLLLRNAPSTRPVPTWHEASFLQSQPGHSDYREGVTVARALCDPAGQPENPDCVLRVQGPPELMET
ncbi:uncharacterized protein LOC134475920 [Cavia porcellus]|uniref:uncharacterized protein LOC134475920 n=1 Tax=Cavia porcellus TaxID=10141 RepID=UPI002FE31F53